MRPTLFALIACLVIGCTHGLTTEKFIPARLPEGVFAAITTQTAQLSGELIALPDEGLVILDQKTLRLVPFNAIRTATFAQVDRIKLSEGRPPDGAARKRLQLLSRYPQGLTPELLAALLRGYGQSALAGVDR